MSERPNMRCGEPGHRVAVGSMRPAGRVAEHGSLARPCRRPCPAIARRGPRRPWTPTPRRHPCQISAMAAHLDTGNPSQPSSSCGRNSHSHPCCDGLFHREVTHVVRATQVKPMVRAAATWRSSYEPNKQQYHPSPALPNLIAAHQPLALRYPAATSTHSPELRVLHAE